MLGTRPCAPSGCPDKRPWPVAIGYAPISVLILAALYTHSMRPNATPSPANSAHTCDTRRRQCFQTSQRWPNPAWIVIQKNCMGATPRVCVHVWDHSRLLKHECGRDGFQTKHVSNRNIELYQRVPEKTRTTNPPADPQPPPAPRKGCWDHGGELRAFCVGTIRRSNTAAGALAASRVGGGGWGKRGSNTIATCHAMLQCSGVL